jgi:phage shock protein PspC (stress-responsive transcriptional regulator)
MEQHHNHTSELRPERRHDGAVLTGVCEGLGHYFGTNPNYFRAAFVALTAFTGGAGLLAYLAAYFAMSPKGQDGQQVTPTL